MTLRLIRATLTSALLLSGCGPAGHSGGDQHGPPATVTLYPDETQLARVALTPKAAERLGITTAHVEEKTVGRQRTLGGEIVVPIGRSIVVSAPYPGTVEAPERGEIPLPGTRLAAGQPVFSFVPLLLPERYVPTPAERAQMANARAALAQAQTIAAGDAARARAEVEAAHIALRRAEQLLKDMAGSARAVDDAQAALNIAQETLTAARVRQSTLDALSLDIEAGAARPVPLTAPQSGVLQNLQAARGQAVTAGAALFEVAHLDSVWIRVPVYVGLMDEIDRSSEAGVTRLDGRPLPSPRTARPVTAPPSADPQSSSADLYYELDNRDQALRPGERVGVTVPLAGSEPRLVIPFAAVLYDVHGNAWVYRKVGENAYERSRVLVSYTFAGTGGERTAVLERGPAAGVEVVVTGAAELFGTEFGHGSGGGH